MICKALNFSRRLIALFELKIMPDNISVIRVKASKEKIWHALTQPAHVKKWQYGSDLITDWKPGSDIRFRTSWEDQVFEQWGKVLEVRPYDLIRYSLFAPRPDLEDVPENYFVMRYMLTDGDGYTEVQIIQEDNRPGALQQEPQGEENAVLQDLKRVAESL